MGDHQPRIRQTRDTALGRKHKLNEYLMQFTDDPQRVATSKLSVPGFQAFLKTVKVVKRFSEDASAVLGVTLSGNKIYLKHFL